MTGGNFESDREDFDSQDQSEALDEANTVGDGDQGEVRTFAEADDISTFEDMPQSEDLTRVDDDLRDDAVIESDARGG